MCFDQSRSVVVVLSVSSACGGSSPSSLLSVDKRGELWCGFVKIDLIFTSCSSSSFCLFSMWGFISLIVIISGQKRRTVVWICKDSSLPSILSVHRFLHIFSSSCIRFVFASSFPLSFRLEFSQPHSVSPCVVWSNCVDGLSGSSCCSSVISTFEMVVS